MSGDASMSCVLVGVIAESLPLAIASPRFEEVVAKELEWAYDGLLEEGEVTLALETYVGGQVPRRHIPYRRRCNVDMSARARELLASARAEQRTDAWFEERRNMITASGAWRLAKTDASWRSLVWEKAGPAAGRSSGGTESAAHWGQRYEPVATALYERFVGVSVYDIGCVVHPAHTFIGASPDGIVPDLGGKLLEIKCVVSREIVGVPTLAYWTQMQWQMACTGMPEVDFLECRFVEYANEAEFAADGGWDPHHATWTDAVPYDGFTGAKGVMQQFHGRDGTFYVYAPLGVSEAGLDTLTQAALDTHTDTTWVTARFWRLEKWSCVTVERNDEWFDAMVPLARRLWEEVEVARTGGADAYKPAQRPRAARPVEAFAVSTEAFLDACSSPGE